MNSLDLVSNHTFSQELFKKIICSKKFALQYLSCIQINWAEFCPTNNAPFIRCPTWDESLVSSLKSLIAQANVSLRDEIREVFCPSPPASTRPAVINLGLSPYSVQVAKLNVIYTRLSTRPQLKGLLMTPHRRHHHFCRNREPSLGKCNIIWSL